MAKSNWFGVDKEGLGKILARRGKEFLLFELLSNAWDEDISQVTATLTRPEHGKSTLTVVDDSPIGWRNLSDAYTLFAESYKKADSVKRGRFNVGEKSVLALCTEATITSTNGQICFNADGTRSTGRAKREAGSEFVGVLRLTLGEYRDILAKAQLLIPPIPTILNGTTIPSRQPVARVTETLPTITADQDGMLRNTTRKTEVLIYDTLPGETATLYELGIPVVETGDKWHVDVQQKVPLNQDRDNVTPAYLRAIRVAVLNTMSDRLTASDATSTWVTRAAEDPGCNVVGTVLDLRYGKNRVSYDPNDPGSAREAQSRGYQVIPGGALPKDMWENARRDGAIQSAGALFPTNLSGKVPNKTYAPEEYTPEMRAYVNFTEQVSSFLVGYKVTVTFIKDGAMVHGQFFGDRFMCNLAHHDVRNWEENIFLMLHELSHTVVKSNDHLCREFYETVNRLGAKLAVLSVERPALFGVLVAALPELV